ncbi:MAG: DUF3426 domain-containing protein [Pseudomonadota bacterium]
MDLYTRCPHCQTVFRLAAEQLDAAGGRVRCGACLRVFPARNSLVRPKTAAAATAAQPAGSVARPASPAVTKPTPGAIPAPAKPAAPTAPELNFDAFFTPPPAAPAPRNEPEPAPVTTTLAAMPTAPTPASTTPAAPTPVGQPDAPDFSLLSAALTEIGPLSAPLAATYAETTAPSASADIDAPAVADSDDRAVTTSAPAAEPIPAIAAEPAAIDADFGLIDSLPLDHDEVDDSAYGEAPVEPKPTAAAAGKAVAAPAAAAEPRPAQSAARDSKRHDPHRLDEPLTPQENSAPDEAALALELPDDWASLKPKARTEPVFDDDNGLLDGELDALTANRSHIPPTARRPRETSERDSLAWLRDDELPEDEARRKDALPVDALHDHRVPAEMPPASATRAAAAKPPTTLVADKLSEPGPAVAPAAPEPRAPTITPHITTNTASSAGIKRSAATEARAPGQHDDEFEWHLDAIEAAAAEPQVFGDWQPDQSDTVKPAAEHDQLIPVRKASATPPTSAPAPAAVATERAAGKPRTQAGDPDLGEISSDWDQPPTAIQSADTGTATPKRMARSARLEPEPFDQNAFTADPADRIYAPADTLDDGSDWTLTATEPPHDYESELYAEPKRRFPWRGLLGTIAALALLSVLVTQLLWPQRAALRADPQWGPWVEQLCGYIECNLPPRTDLGKIELQQRSVLKDRDDPRKLQIDLLIANKAAFAQPYPDINLRFTNIEGELVAERRFKPSEYLREQPDSAEMPVGVPVHIAFSVKAPDGNITGYEFNFLPPQ